MLAYVMGLVISMLTWSFRSMCRSSCRVESGEGGPGGGGGCIKYFMRTGKDWLGAKSCPIKCLRNNSLRGRDLCEI